MKILMLCDNYLPETNAPARIFSELAELWVKEGEDVCVVTSHPNFPRGVIFDGYKNKWITKSEIKGVKVCRVKTYMHPNKGVFRRALDFASFGLSSFLLGLFKNAQDIIIGVTPQFFSALSACCLSIVKRKPFVMILCDLWPDSILANRMISKGLFFWIIKKIEIWMYRKSHSIVVLSEYFRGYLLNLGIPNNKIISSISGANKKFYPKNKNKKILKAYQLEKKFIVGYIGTFGISHNHEDILSVAESLQQKNINDIHFLMIGDGAKRESLLEQKNHLNLNNLSIEGPFPRDDIPEYWSLVDIAIVPLASTETNKTVLPSKILEAMSMGKPIVLYAPSGEASHFLKQSKAGWYVPAGEINELERCIEYIAKHRYLINDKSDCAIEFSREFTREKQATELRMQLETLYNQKVHYEKI